jgi:hypothetical protein
MRRGVMWPLRPNVGLQRTPKAVRCKDLLERIAPTRELLDSDRDGCRDGPATPVEERKDVLLLKACEQVALLAFEQ